MVDHLGLLKMRQSHGISSTGTMQSDHVSNRELLSHPMQSGLDVDMQNTVAPPSPGSSATYFILNGVPQNQSQSSSIKFKAAFMVSRLKELFSKIRKSCWNEQDELNAAEYDKIVSEYDKITATITAAATTAFEPHSSSESQAMYPPNQVVKPLKLKQQRYQPQTQVKQHELQTLQAARSSNKRLRRLSSGLMIIIDTDDIPLQRVMQNQNKPANRTPFPFQISSSNSQGISDEEDDNEDDDENNLTLAELSGLLPRRTSSNIPSLTTSSSTSSLTKIATAAASDKVAAETDDSLAPLSSILLTSTDSDKNIQPKSPKKSEKIRRSVSFSHLSVSPSSQRKSFNPMKMSPKALTSLQTLSRSQSQQTNQISEYQSVPQLPSAQRPFVSYNHGVSSPLSPLQSSSQSCNNTILSNRSLSPSPFSPHTYRHSSSFSGEGLWMPIVPTAARRKSHQTPPQMHNTVLVSSSQFLKRDSVYFTEPLERFSKQAMEK